MATIYPVLGIICLTFSGQPVLPDCGVLKPERTVSVQQDSPGRIQRRPVSDENAALKKNQAGILSVARSEIGVRELTGNNDGARVEKYLHYVGLKKGDPWCAAFVSWVYGQAGYTAPRTGWSPALFPKNLLLTSQSTEAAEGWLKGAVFGIYSASSKRIVHCGIIEQRSNTWIYTIEGNTNTTGSREGDGVYRRRRPVHTVRSIALWHVQKQKGGGDGRK